MKGIGYGVKRARLDDDKLIDDFEIEGFGSLVGTAGLISVAAWLLPRIF